MVFGVLLYYFDLKLGNNQFFERMLKFNDTFVWHIDETNLHTYDHTL